MHISFIFDDHSNPKSLSSSPGAPGFQRQGLPASHRWILGERVWSRGHVQTTSRFDRPVFERTHRNFTVAMIAMIFQVITWRICIYIYTDTHTDTHTQTRHNGLYLWYNAHLPKTGFIIWFSVFIALTFAEWQGIASLIFAGHDERQGPRRRHFERHLGSTCERGGWLMMIGRFFYQFTQQKKIGWFTMGTVVGSTAEKQE